MKKLTIIAGMIILGFITSNLFADGAKLFKSKCGACHTLKVDGKKVSGGTVGPDLTGVAKQHSEKFIKLYMTKPVQARKKYAKNCEHLIKKCGKSGLKMPSIMLKKEQVNQIYEALK